MYVFVYCACVCAGDVMFVSILGKVRVYMYVHVCMFVCMYVCVCARARACVCRVCARLCAERVRACLQ